MLNLFNYLLIFPAVDSSTTSNVEVETDIEDDEDIEDEEEFDEFIEGLQEDLELLKEETVKNQEIMLNLNDRMERLENILKSIFKKGEN
jgi:hypothetical protein